jgi:hypothetical protein
MHQEGGRTGRPSSIGTRKQRFSTPIHPAPRAARIACQHDRIGYNAHALLIETKGSPVTQFARPRRALIVLAKASDADAAGQYHAETKSAILEQGQERLARSAEHDAGVARQEDKAHMTGTAKPDSFFIGWDVGGWNCDKNALSRDAIVILDSTLTIVGKPWRGNLRECIARTSTTGDWVKAMFAKCFAAAPEPSVSVTMAIDTPLGFPEAFVRLVTHVGWSEPDATSGMNRYLFRHSERHLFQQGKTSLSAIKDMIGSQATKGMHVLSKFAPIVESCGVWTDGESFHAIETYPAVCRDAREVKLLLHDRLPLPHVDMDDALICAFVAYLFVRDRNALEEPTADVPLNEGWIWATRQPDASTIHQASI